jgi:ADP-heptose:LPS heptosyltransferase
MSVTSGIAFSYPDAQIHWVTRKDLAPMLRTDSQIDTLWEFDRNKGLLGLIKLAFKLRKQNYDIIYDAHLNMRSFIVKVLCYYTHPSFFNRRKKLIVRPKKRFNRFLFFKLNVRNALPLPFRGMVSFQKPLKKAGVSFKNLPSKQWHFPENVVSKVEALFSESNFTFDKNTITIIPSAAWELKRWPVKHWKELIKILPGYNFVVLGGPEDVFIDEITSVAADRTLNLAGRTNLMESFYIVSESHFVVSADTGFLHAADLFGINGIALMGPTAFGHTTGNTIKVMEIDLSCRPCTKEGNSKCKLMEIKKCLVDITPQMVRNEISIRKENHKLQ